MSERKGTQDTRPNKPLISKRKRKTRQPVSQPSDVRNIPDSSESRTLAQALTIFVRAKEAQDLRSSTIRSYIRHVDYLSDYLTEVEGILNPFIDDLSADVIRRYIRYMLKEKRRYASSTGRKDKSVGLSANTVNIRLRTLRTMCRFWYAEGIAKENAMANVKDVSTDQEEEVPGLSDATVDVILSSFNETQFAEWRDKIICLLMLDTGLRPTEAVELTVERIDFRMLTIYVPSQVAKNRRNREVPLSKEVADLLKEIYEESQEYFGETEQIFNTTFGEPMSANSFRKRLNRLKVKLGIDRLSPNQFRHTFCRSYLLNGGDVFTLQKIVDHADIKTTRKYVQMETEHVRAQHNKFSPVRRLYKRR